VAVQPEDALATKVVRKSLSALRECNDSCCFETYMLALMDNRRFLAGAVL
jgi:hypothetical protein